MFHNLKVFKNVIVTGCQRSGTTICSRMIKNDYPYRELIDEDNYGVHNVKKFFEFLIKDKPIVVHAPAMLHVVHLVPTPVDTCIVMMKRNINDIHASEKRINWVKKSGHTERKKYCEVEGENKGLSIAELKYKFWEVIKPRMKERFIQYIEIEYESLKFHPLWINKEERKGWGARQWKNN